jgi:hypothetical protein
MSRWREYHWRPTRRFEDRPHESAKRPVRAVLRLCQFLMRPHQLLSQRSALETSTESIARREARLAGRLETLGLGHHTGGIHGELRPLRNVKPPAFCYFFP